MVHAHTHTTTCTTHRYPLCAQTRTQVAASTAAAAAAADTSASPAAADISASSTALAATTTAAAVFTMENKRQELVDKFDALDKDRNGTLSKEELGDTLSEAFGLSDSVILRIFERASGCGGGIGGKSGVGKELTRDMYAEALEMLEKETADNAQKRAAEGGRSTTPFATFAEVDTNHDGVSIVLCVVAMCNVYLHVCEECKACGVNDRSVVSPTEWVGVEGGAWRGLEGRGRGG